MIVNTAYAYMGTAGPADPKLWGDGQVYVPYTLAGGATFNPNVGGAYGSYFELPSTTAGAEIPSVTLTINAKGYTKISMKAVYSSTYGGTIQFEFKKSGTTLGTVDLPATQYVTEYQIDIPEAARINNVELVMRKKVNPSGSRVTFYQPGYML